MSNARVSQHSSNRIDEPIPCVWQKADRNNGKILVTPDNHTWALNGKTSKKWFYKCRFRLKTKCPASVTADVESDTGIKFNSEHNHDTDKYVSGGYFSVLLCSCNVGIPI